MPPIGRPLAMVRAPPSAIAIIASVTMNGATPRQMMMPPSAPTFGPSRDMGAATNRGTSLHRDGSLALPTPSLLPAATSISLDPGMANPRLLSRLEEPVGQRDTE